MPVRKVIWLPRVRIKLLEYRSPYFTPEETLEYIGKFIKEVENLLGNSIFNMSPKEELGLYKGINRIIVGKFRIYYEFNNKDILFWHSYFQ